MKSFHKIPFFLNDGFPKGKIIEPEIICSMHSMHCTIAIAYQIFASFFCDVKKYTLKSHTVCKLVHLI